MVYAGGRAVAQVTQTEDGDSTTTPVVSYLHDDVLGSTQSVTNADGTQNTPRSFGLFGTADDALTASDVPYGFTGQEEDVELGLINMHGRMYDSTLGQFMSPDPVIQSPDGQGLNRFAYAMNSPLNYVDPSGFTSQGTTLGIDIGIGAGFAGGLAATLLGDGGYGAPMEVGESVGGSVGGAALGGGAAAGGAEAAGGITSAGAANALAGAGAIAHAALQDIALSGMNAVHTTTTVTPTANTNVSNLGGSPPINRTAFGQMGTAPVQERSASGPVGQQRSAPQARIDREYNRLGLNFPYAPRYNPKLSVYGLTDPNTGKVSIGPRAVNSSSSVLRSTLIHENTHITQAREGNIPQSDLGGQVAEAEAYRSELLHYQQSGLTQEEQQQVAVEYARRLDNISQYGKLGETYLKRILIYENFGLLPGDAYGGPTPDWLTSP
jgi:RHS repeat-associated protein